MIGLFFQQLKWFVLLTLLQVLVFNHIHIAGYATPLPYVYFLLLLPSDTSRAALLLWGFALGLTVDTFTNTPGAAAAAMTLLAMMRPGLLMLFGPHDKDENAYVPSAALFHWGAFTGYVFISALLHEAAFFTLEAFSFFNWKELLINIGSSTTLTTLIVLAFEGIRSSYRSTPDI